jgi:uncharacterized protein (DUF58 family)
MSNRRNAFWLLNIVLLLVGTFTGQTVFFSLTYLLVGLLVMSLLWSWLAVRGVRIGRKTRTRRSQVGRNFVEEFSAHNGFFLPKLWLEVRDYSDLPRHRASHVVPTLLPGKDYHWRVDTQCIVRGQFQLGPMTVISGDPFGLFLTPRRINAIERIIVYPAIVPIAQFRLPIGMISGGEPQRFITQNITTNAAGVRDYVHGDALNRVHWKSTARRNKLIVKEFELDPLADIWLFLDLSTESLIEASNLHRFGNAGAAIPNGSGLPPSTEEYAVVIAASLATHFIDIERALGFVTYTPNREVFQPERGHRQLTRILEILAVARSQSKHSLREMVTLETPHIKRGATLVFITSSLEITWIAELNALARRGIRPMCIYLQPESFGGYSSEEVRGRLHLMKIPTIVINHGDNLSAALAQRPI